MTSDKMLETARKFFAEVHLPALSFKYMALYVMFALADYYLEKFYIEFSNLGWNFSKKNFI